MTKIEFLLLPDNASAGDMFTFVCQRARAVHDRGGLYIHGKDEAECRALDEQLHTATPDKPFQHALACGNLASNECTGIHNAEIVLGCDHEPDGSHQTLLNVSGALPWFFSRFERLIELIQSDEKAREMGRERYLYYKTRGYPLTHRQL